MNKQEDIDKQLRIDKFALEFLTCLCYDLNEHEIKTNKKEIANLCYDAAEAMEEERSSRIRQRIDK